MATVRVVDDVGNPIPNYPLTAKDYSSGAKIYAANGNNFHFTDSNGIATFEVPNSGQLILVSMWNELPPEMEDKYSVSKQAEKMVTTTSPPGPTPLTFIIPRKKPATAPTVPATPTAPPSGPQKTAEETAGISKTTLIVGGLTLAAVVGGAIYFFTRD